MLERVPHNVLVHKRHVAFHAAAQNVAADREHG